MKLSFILIKWYYLELGNVLCIEWSIRGCHAVIAMFLHSRLVNSFLFIEACKYPMTLLSSMSFDIRGNESKHLIEF